MTEPVTGPIRKRARLRAKPAGLPPGSMVHVGEQKVERVRISRIRYSRDHRRASVSVALK